ncbi:hypothetical protein ACIBCH_36645 [Amycolatopsis thailandensis]|uniref:hypothetical protein n=1 Tax=Amycolatopsis thailandensis TaxID=589330 RepID=UPI00378BCD00
MTKTSGRPTWQRKVLRIVNPAWRARERRVAAFTQLVDRAAAEARDAWIERAAELLRRVEEDGTPYAEVKDEIWEAWSHLPKDAQAPTEEETAMAYRTIRMYLAVCGSGQGRA